MGCRHLHCWTKCQLPGEISKIIRGPDALLRRQSHFLGWTEEICIYETRKSLDLSMKFMGCTHRKASVPIQHIHSSVPDQWCNSCLSSLGLRGGLPLFCLLRTTPQDSLAWHGQPVCHTMRLVGPQPLKELLSLICTNDSLVIELSGGTWFSSRTINPRGDSPELLSLNLSHLFYVEIQL